MFLGSPEASREVTGRFGGSWKLLEVKQQYWLCLSRFVFVFQFFVFEFVSVVPLVLCVVLLGYSVLGIARNLQRWPWKVLEVPGGHGRFQKHCNIMLCVCPNMFQFLSSLFAVCIISPFCLVLLGYICCTRRL